MYIVGRHSTDLVPTCLYIYDGWAPYCAHLTADLLKNKQSAWFRSSAVLHDSGFLTGPVTVFLVGAFVMGFLALGGADFELDLAL